MFRATIENRLTRVLKAETEEEFKIHEDYLLTTAPLFAVYYAKSWKPHVEKWARYQHLNCETTGIFTIMALKAATNSFNLAIPPKPRLRTS